MLLLRTIHGSRLYGLNHAGSDYDYWEVHSNKPTDNPAKQIKQTIKDGLDVVQMNLSTFMLYANRSSHQVLDCMFSQYAEVDMLSALRENYVLNTGSFVPLYRRTIPKFSMREVDQGLDAKFVLKSKRHAVRMCYQLQDGLAYGRFNPTLSEERRSFLLQADAEELDRCVLEALGPEALETERENLKTFSQS